MAFALRDAVGEDLNQCLALTTDRFLYNAVELGALWRMWRHVITAKCGPAVIVVDVKSPSRVLFFAVVVFVTDEIADAYHRLERPGIARVIVDEFDAGERPFLSRDDVARANAGTGLNVVVTHHGYAERFDESDESLRAATYAVGLKCLSGWNLRTYTNEVFARNSARDGQQMGEANGLTVKTYTKPQLHAAHIPEGRAPCMWLARRGDFSANPAINVMLFNFTPPKFGFSSEQQDILLLALDGHTDESIARALCASLSTVKKRFHAIYREVQTGGLPSDGTCVEKTAPSDPRPLDTRRGLLNYLREHPEELRPYYTSAAGKAHSRGVR